MPTTRTIDTQTYEGESIECAKFVSDVPFSWKAKEIVPVDTDYQFQMVIKASSSATILIHVGDSGDTLSVTTSFDRYIVSFPNVTTAISDSLYITFPAGTFWVYNVQLERAGTPSAWRPAPEDAEDYADEVSQSAAQLAVNSQTQLDIFNKLTNNGATQGIYLSGSDLYINGSYIRSGTLDASLVTVVNLIADHLQSFGNSNQWKLDSQSSYLRLLQLVNGVWKMRVGLHISNADGGTITAGKGDVSEDGSTVSGSGLRSYMQANNLVVGADANGNVTGYLSTGELHTAGTNKVFTTEYLDAVDDYVDCVVTNMRYLLVEFHAGYAYIQTVVIPVTYGASLTYGGGTSSLGLRFSVTRISSTPETLRIKVTQATDALCYINRVMGLY